MPCHDFACGDCGTYFEEFCQKHDDTGKYTDVACPSCRSHEHKLIPSVFGLSFADPTTSSKFDNFEYRAGYNLDKARGIRRQGEASNHMGSNVHANIDDLNRPGVFGEVQ